MPGFLNLTLIMVVKTEDNLFEQYIELRFEIQ